MSSEFDFQLDLEKKRPRWREALYMCSVMVLIWGTTQALLNFSAYSQIAKFKWDTFTDSLHASVIASDDNLSSTGPDITETVLKPFTKKRKKTELKTVERTITFKKRELEVKDKFKDVFSQMSVFPSDNRIYLPRINKNVPLVDVPGHQDWAQLEEMIQEGLRNGVVVHPISRSPGQNGNFFATGHSSYYSWDNGRFKDVFALLHEVELGDKVYIYWEGKEYVYQMEEKKVVPPTQVDVLDHPEDKSILTLMTCTPVGTNKNRLILQGRLLES